MNRSNKKRIVYLLAAVTMACGAWAATSGELLQQALYAEEIEGDLPAAIAGYEKVISDASASEQQIAQSLYRKSMCHVRLKQDDQAVVLLARLVSQYSGQTDLIEKAESMLESLQVFDPAMLMPPDTLAYLELGSTGKQLETILEMLKGTPLEDPLALLAESDPAEFRSGQGAMMAGLLNPATQEEFKKVRGMAVGLVELSSQAPAIVAAIHLGDSAMLHGLAMTGLSMGTRPGPVVEGMQTYSIGGQVDIACDNKVFLIAFPKSRLPWMIRQYRHLSLDASLAGDASFLKLDKAVRSQNLATVWVDADRLYTAVEQVKAGQEFPGNGPAPLFHINGMGITADMIGIDSLDSLMVTASLATNAVSLTGCIGLKDDMSNMVYEMFKTAPLQRDGLKGVPPEAFCLASVALSTNNPGQLLQLRQLLRIGNGEPLPVGYLENIEQVTLFALPGEARIPEGMPFRPGFVLTCRDVAPVEELLRERVLQSPDLPSLIIVEADKHTILLSFEESVEMASFAAMKPESSVLKQGVLHNVVQQKMDSAKKMVLVNAGGLVRLIGIQSVFHSGAEPETAEKLKAAFAALADAMETMTLSVCTDEEPSMLSLQARLDGFPSLEKLIGPIGEIQQVTAEAEQQQAEARAREQAAKLEELMNLPPARIVETTTSPVIDGEMDDVWNAAVNYDLARTIYVNPGPEAKPSARYRMMWDAQKLYVFIDVTDSTPAKNPQQIWQFNDGIELYLDASDSKPAGYGDTQFQFGLLWNADDAVAICAQEHGRTVRAIETGLKNTEKGYCFEVAFLWSELGATPADGAHIGVEVQVNDNRGRGGRDAKISWHDPYDQAWLNPQYFGRAVLVGAGE
ncbi:MAG: CBM9 family sugar-binding protein [Pontiellaceae bacterium]|nr:CBM9 family sugar-binding protein [Pontiellaceae bacterium]MBN2785623.1 CBM9 family sugar-binding protein [Pontiellaceae bacterium]